MVDYKIVIKKTITKHRESAVSANDLVEEIMDEIRDELSSSISGSAELLEYFDIDVFEQQNKPAWVKRKVEMITDDA